MLTYDEFCEKLEYKGEYINRSGSTQISFGEIDGRCMFTLRTTFPRWIGDVYEEWWMCYSNPRDGKANVEKDPDTYEETHPLNGTVYHFEKCVGEKIEGLVRTECPYYHTKLIFTDEASAMKCAYEMYRRRRQFNIEHD